MRIETLTWLPFQELDEEAQERAIETFAPYYAQHWSFDDLCEESRYAVLSSVGIEVDHKTSVWWETMPTSIDPAGVEFDLEDIQRDYLSEPIRAIVERIERMYGTDGLRHGIVWHEGEHAWWPRTSAGWREARRQYNYRDRAEPIPLALLIDLRRFCAQATEELHATWDSIVDYIGSEEHLRYILEINKYEFSPDGRTMA